MRLVLALGSNLGHRAQHLKKARDLLSKAFGKISKASEIYETLPWGLRDQPIFLNQVIVFDIDVPAEQCLSVCLAIEKKLGRIRGQKWDARIIDIDMLYYEDMQIDTEQLTLPHPYLDQRRFVLEPLVEILPDFKHPYLHKSNSDLLTSCPDRTHVQAYAP